MKFEINMALNIDTRDLLAELSKQEYNLLKQFIKDLDMYVADWEFTEMMYNYFKQEMQDFVNENEEKE